MATKPVGNGLRARVNSNEDLLVSTRPPNTLNAAPHNETEAQADHALVAAPGAGKRLVITRLQFSNGATPGTILFEAATAGAKTQYGPKWYMAANDKGNPEVYYVLGENLNFGFTSAAMTTHSVSCEYHIEPL